MTGFWFMQKSTGKSQLANFSFLPFPPIKTSFAPVIKHLPHTALNCEIPAWKSYFSYRIANTYGLGLCFCHHRIPQIIPSAAFHITLINYILCMCEQINESFQRMFPLPVNLLKTNQRMTREKHLWIEFLAPLTENLGLYTNKVKV